MKLWLDDFRKPPDGFEWAKSVNQAISMIMESGTPEYIDLDHDLGNYAADGGDGIRLLDYLLEHEIFCQVSLHTANPVGRQNMERMILRYWPDGFYDRYHKCGL